jgi:hypothetical protein
MDVGCWESNEGDEMIAVVTKDTNVSESWNRLEPVSVLPLW